GTRGAVHTPSRSYKSPPRTTARPVAQPAAQPSGRDRSAAWKCRCQGSPSCRSSSGRAPVRMSSALTWRAASSTAPVLTASKTPRSSAATKQRLAASSQVASRRPAPRSTAPTAGVRLLARLPRATIIGIDADPVSLTLGRAAYSGVPGLRFADLDLRVPGWSARLGLGTRAPDAAVSTTALHWLPEPELRAMYAELATVLRPGGLLLDGDHFSLDAKESPVLARLGQALRQREDERRFPGGHPENWHDWWGAAAADPALAGHV